MISAQVPGKTGYPTINCCLLAELTANRVAIGSKKLGFTRISEIIPVLCWLNRQARCAWSTQKVGGLQFSFKTLEHVLIEHYPESPVWA